MIVAKNGGILVHQVDIKYCNNIKSGSIQIEPNKLNIKYGINGTGKTTIAKAIQYSKDNNMLQNLKSYFADEDASVVVTPSFDNILVFNESFVDQVVFKEDKVIENTFEIFLKTPNYDEKKAQLDQHLQRCTKGT